MVTCNIEPVLKYANFNRPTNLTSTVNISIRSADPSQVSRAGMVGCHQDLDKELCIHTNIHTNIKPIFHFAFLHEKRASATCARCAPIFFAVPIIRQWLAGFGNENRAQRDPSHTHTYPGKDLVPEQACAHVKYPGYPEAKLFDGQLISRGIRRC